MLFDQVTENKYGYYELKKKPSGAELEDYYTRKYFQLGKGTYKKEYTAEELVYIHNRLERKYHLLKKTGVQLSRNTRFLDIGCGEGWALAFFDKKGLQVEGVDYSIYACQSCNPDYAHLVTAGNPLEVLDEMMEQNTRFDVVQLDNVLEHVLDPENMLTKIRTLLGPGGAVIIEVPNDFSPLQRYLYEHKQIEHPFWIAVPDHISYFNPEGLTRLAESLGYRRQCITGDYPIDLHLFHPATNYVKNKETGKIAHQTRLHFENLLSSLSADKTNDMYEAMMTLGISRQIIAVFSSEQS